MDNYVSPIWERLAAQRAENQRRGKHTPHFGCPETVAHATTHTYEAAAFTAGFAPTHHAKHADLTDAGQVIAGYLDDQARTLAEKGYPERYVGRHSDQKAARIAALPASKYWPVKA